MTGDISETERPQEQVALFIDFENIRYSVLNTYGREVGGQMLMEKARKHGLVTLSRAYADFSEHPDRVQRDLQVSGITAINVAAHKMGDSKKSGADMEMLMDIFETFLDRPFVKTFVLMTGDRHFIRAVTIARNRYGKTVIIAGVPGSVSNDLVEAAGSNFDPLVFEPVGATERFTSFVRFCDRLERSKPFITFKYISAAMSTSSEFPGLQEEEARQLVADAIRDGILMKEQRTDGYRVCKLNRNHGGVKDVLAGRAVTNLPEHHAAAAAAINAAMGILPGSPSNGGHSGGLSSHGGGNGGYGSGSSQGSYRPANQAFGPTAVDPQEEWRRRARELGLPDVEEEEEAMYRTGAPTPAPISDDEMGPE
ncbi:MAG: NYN domain-containing protein [Candidatus Eisenbacteria bacterium]|nr:NYN domain-containing protein [Candidatus Eisenbacteria bacterium]